MSLFGGSSIFMKDIKKYIDKEIKKMSGGTTGNVEQPRSLDYMYCFGESYDNITPPENMNITLGRVDSFGNTDTYKKIKLHEKEKSLEIKQVGSLSYEFDETDQYNKKLKSIKAVNGDGCFLLEGKFYVHVGRELLTDEEVEESNQVRLLLCRYDSVSDTTQRDEICNLINLDQEPQLQEFSFYTLLNEGEQATLEVESIFHKEILSVAISEVTLRELIYNELE